jgi:hypothetical protein
MVVKPRLKILLFPVQFAMNTKAPTLRLSLKTQVILFAFFNPRTDRWEDHFEIDESGEILPRSNIGRATIKIFNFNHPESIIERKELKLKGLL